MAAPRLAVVLLLLTACALVGATPAVPAAAEVLTVTVSGKGTVVSSPAGISCPRKCRVVLRKGASIKLRARPAAGWKFAGWAGGCRSQTNPGCIVWLRVAKRVQARFTVSRPPPPPPPKPVPAAFAPKTLAGTWSGTWQNTRFESSGPASIRYQVPDANSFIFTLNLGGNVFGCGSLPPASGTVTAGTGPNTWNADGFNLQLPSAVGGTISIAYDAATQTLTANGSSGCRPGVSWALRGTFGSTTFSGTLTILLEDGSTASGAVTLSRPAPP